MTNDTSRDLLVFATEVAWRAGLATLAHFQTDIAVETKPDLSPVTAADREAESIIRALISARYPADAVLGEEYGESEGSSARRWIIDPIDGTRSFVRGVPLYGVLIGIEEEGEMVGGVMHFPALNETVAAVRGAGCWWNGRRARVSRCVQLRDALVCTSDAENAVRHTRSAAFDRVRARAGMVRTWGDCYGYALVATGRAEAMFDAELSVWDAAAVVPIITEAGGVILDWAGRASWRSGDLIAVNAELAGDIRATMEES